MTIRPSVLAALRDDIAEALADCDPDELLALFSLAVEMGFPVEDLIVIAIAEVGHMEADVQAWWRHDNCNCDGHLN